MAWSFKNLTMQPQLGQRATIFGLAALVNPSAHVHKPTKHVFFQGRNPDGSGDGHIHEYWSDGNWQHNDLTNNTGAPLAADIGLSSYMFQGQGTKHVIYQGFDEGANGRINELWWDGDWHPRELAPGPNNAPLTIGRPFGYEYSFFDTISKRNKISQRVVYRTLDDNIHQLWWDPSTDWGHEPLTNTADAIFDPTAYVFTVHGHEVPAQASQRVLYRSLEDILKDVQHVHELTWNEIGPNNSQWVPNDLTALFATPLTDEQPVGLMHDLEFTLHLFYGAKDGHLYELWWNYLGWHVNDLTAMTSSAHGGGGPLPYVHLQQGTLNANYVGAGGHIHALWRHTGEEWNSANKQDLTIMTSPGPAPPAASGLVGFVFRDLTQHIFYIADNSPISHIGDVIELTDE